MFLRENNGSTATVLHKKDHDEALVRSDSLLPARISRKSPYLLPEDQKDKIASIMNELKLLNPTPLRPTNKVELCSKWGLLFPKEAAVITFPKASCQIIELVRERRIEKNRSKVDSKKMAEV